MNKIAQHRPKLTFQKMLEDKQQLAKYFITRDEADKPKGVKFVNPFTLPSSLSK
ncbi:hypothetical protein GCM10027578_04900 [Spirosoma luteolum]